jgi:hypothetical protein
MKGVEEKTSFIGKMFGYGKKKDVRAKNPDVASKIYKVLHEIIVAALNCWNHTPVLDLRDFFFTRSGMFSYHTDDEQKAIEILEKFHANRKA